MKLFTMRALRWKVKGKGAAAARAESVRQACCSRAKYGGARLLPAINLAMRSANGRDYLPAILSAIPATMGTLNSSC